MFPTNKNRRYGQQLMGSIQIFPLAEKCFVQSYLKRARQCLRKLAILRLWTLLLISHVISVRRNVPLLPCAEVLLILSTNQQCFTQIATVILALLFISPLIFSPEGSFLVEDLRGFS